MTARSESIQIDIDDEQMSGTFLSPKSKVPGVLFVHGWGGSQERDLERAKGIAGLGCVCLTFDLRGHTGGTGIPLSRVTREDNLRDLLAAYDRLLAHPALDTSAIAVVGSILIAGARESDLTTILGTIAVAASMTNIVSGFLITDRMLKMFKEKKPR